MRLTKKQAVKKYPQIKFCGEKTYYVAPGAVIEPGVVIEPGAVIGPSAFIESGAVIESAAVIGAGASIGSGSVIRSSAVIRSNARIEPGVRIAAGANIGSGRKGVRAALILNGLGKTKEMTAHDSEDGLIIVIGCLNDYKGASLEEVKIAVSEKYPESHPYFTALKLAQVWYESL